MESTEKTFTTEISQSFEIDKDLNPVAIADDTLAKKNSFEKLTVLDVEEHKIYTSEMKLLSGEIAYFGFEPIFDSKRSEGWADYVKKTSVLCSNRGFFRIFFYTEDSSDSQLEMDKKFFDEFFSSNTTHKEEIWRLLTKIKKDKYEIMEKAMNGIDSGCIGFCSSYGEGNYVGYISKKPITGFASFPKSSSGWNDLEAYTNAYDNIVMVISSYTNKIDNSNFEHRGIFRNPLSMLRKDYQGVGVLLHAFSAYARSMAFPEVKVMFVSPDGNKKMRELLIEQFPDAECKFYTYFVTVDFLKKHFMMHFEKDMSK